MPFSNISEKDKDRLIELLKGHIYTFNKNEEILTTIRAKNILCIVLEGNAQIIKTTYNGDEIIVENLKENSIFSSNFSDIDSLDTIIMAKSRAKILVFNYNFIMNFESNLLIYNTFIKNLFRILNQKTKDHLYQMRILYKKNIRDKLLEFFEIEYEQNHSKYIDLKMPLKDFADYIGANRSAMFRELKNLKDDKIIELKNKRITLLYKNKDLIY